MFQCIYTGILLDYTVERWVDNYTSVVLQTLTPSGGRSFVDEGGQLQPYTKYTYRVSASTCKLTLLKLFKLIFVSRLMKAEHVEN